MEQDKKRFLKNSAGFLVVLIIATILMNYVYSTFVFEKTVTYQKFKNYNVFISNLTDNEVKYAFFGSSHTQKDINPTFIPDAYNYGENGQNYFSIYYRLNEVLYLNKEVKIKKMILEIDLHNFHVRLSDAKLLNTADIKLHSKYIPYSELRKVYNSSDKLWKEKYLPFIGNGQDFIDASKALPDKLTLGGYLQMTSNLTASPQGRKDEGLRIADNHFKDKKKIDNQTFEYFVKTIEFAKKNNLELVFLICPSTKEYSDAVNADNVSRNETYRLVFEAINSTLGNNYTVLDYYSLYWKYPEYFADGDHLNYVGAEFFSKQIYSDLQNLENKSNATRFVKLY